MTLTEFLLARIAEDEAVARDAVPTGWVTFRQPDGSLSHTALGTPEEDGWVVDGRLVQDEGAEVFFDPARVLAECEAKRRIVERLAQAERLCRGNAEAYSAAMHSIPLDQSRITAFKTHGWELAGRRDGLRYAVDEIASIYADHPDCREEWKP